MNKHNNYTIRVFSHNRLIAEGGALTFVGAKRTARAVIEHKIYTGKVFIEVLKKNSPEVIFALSDKTN
jgi:hypothetical protein